MSVVTVPAVTGDAGQVASGSSFIGGTVGSVLFVGTGPIITQNNSALFWDNTNLAISQTSPVSNLTTRAMNYWIDSTDPDAKKFALTLGDAGVWSTGSSRRDVVMNFGYNLNAQGPIDTGDVAWGLQFETFACRGSQLSQSTGDVEFWLCYTEPGGYSVRPIGVDVDRTTHISDIFLRSTNFNHTGDAAGSFSATEGYYSFGGYNPGSGNSTVFTFQGAAYTGITASTEKIFSNFDTQTNSWTWATGAITTQRFNLFGQPTINFAGASTVTSAATVWIAGAPVAGTNATLTNSFALVTASGDVLFDTAANRIGLWWISSSHTLKVMNSASNYVTLAHDGSNSVLTSNGTGNLNLISNSSTITFGNNFYSMQWVNAGLQGSTDGVMNIGTSSKRNLDGYFAGTMNLSKSGVAMIFTNATTTTGANTGTLTNCPHSGDPALYLEISVNGTTYAVPCFALT